MKILHYTLGLPPYRTGGLTKYSIDLIEEQSKYNDVSMVFPGKYSLNKKTKVRKYGKYNTVGVYEIINPLPVPLLGGIKKVEYYIKRDRSAYYVFYRFLNKLNPDVIHIHTLMGLHYEFIDAAKDIKIKIVYTAHDYFGICPKVNLIDYQGLVCDNFNCGQKCIECNTNAYDFKLIYLMQSSIYRKLKDNILVKKLRKYKKRKITSNSGVVKKDNRIITVNKHDYIKLREFYMEYFLNFNYIHFNSSVTKNIFNKYGIFNHDILSITHKDICDERSKKRFNIEENLKILYLGPCEEYKGFYLLKQALESLNDDNWQLSVYGNSYDVDCGNLNNKINFYGRYKYEDLENIFQQNDILVIPSIWYETFGFTLLEGLSHGMPIITTEYVGAKDIIKNNYNGLIIKPDKDNLANLLETIIKEKEILERINENIVKSDIKFDLRTHNNMMIDIYNRVLRGD